MWRNCLWRTRLSLLLALVLTLGLAINITRLVLEAGPSCSGGRSKRDTAGPPIHRNPGVGLNDTPDADARLSRIVGDLNRLRHVSITRQDDGVKAEPAAGDRLTDDGGPRSVARLVCAPRSPGKDRGELSDFDQRSNRARS